LDGSLTLEKKRPALNSVCMLLHLPFRGYCECPKQIVLCLWWQLSDTFTAVKKWPQNNHFHHFWWFSSSCTSLLGVNVPANDQTVDSILAFNLVLSWGIRWVDWHSSFIPTKNQNQQSVIPSHTAFHNTPQTDQICVNVLWSQIAADVHKVLESGSDHCKLVLRSSEKLGTKDLRLLQVNILTIWQWALGFPPQCKKAWRGSSPKQCGAARPPGSLAS